MGYFSVGLKFIEGLRAVLPFPHPSHSTLFRAAFHLISWMAVSYWTSEKLQVSAFYVMCYIT